MGVNPLAAAAHNPVLFLEAAEREMPPRTIRCCFQRQRGGAVVAVQHAGDCLLSGAPGAVSIMMSLLSMTIIILLSPAWGPGISLITGPGMSSVMCWASQRAGWEPSTGSRHQLDHEPGDQLGRVLCELASWGSGCLMALALCGLASWCSRWCVLAGGPESVLHPAACLSVLPVCPWIGFEKS